MESKEGLERIFKTILDNSFKVHTALGPGLLENAYEECLYYELVNAGLFVKKQAPLSKECIRNFP